MSNNTWYCPQCSANLGSVVGGEFHTKFGEPYLRTSGPNLVCTCPECGNIKTWYTADAVVRAIHQLVDAVASAAAKAMIREVGKQRRSMEKEQ